MSKTNDNNKRFKHAVIYFFAMATIPLSVRGLAEIDDAVAPEHYGAVPGDGRDDTQALQSAVDNHDDIYLNGEYEISRTVTLRSGVRIRSNGVGGLLMKAGVDGFNNLDPKEEFASNVVGLFGQDVADIQLKNFYIRKEFQENSSASAITVRGGRNVEISGLDISGFSNGLVIALDSVEWGFVTSNYIHDSYTSSEAQHTAIAIDSSRLIKNGVILNSSSLLVKDNFVVGLQVSANLRARNRVETDGINIAGPETHDVWLLNNAIAQVGEGIDSFGQRINIRDNNLYENYIFGIKLVHGASNTTVSNNQIYRPAKVGIVLAGSSVVSRDTHANSIIDNYISGVGQNLDINWRPQFTAGISLESNGGQTGNVVDNFIDTNRIALTASMDFGVNCDVPYSNEITNLQLDGPALKEGLRDCR